MSGRLLKNCLLSAQGTDKHHKKKLKRQKPTNPDWSHSTCQHPGESLPLCWGSCHTSRCLSDTRCITVQFCLVITKPQEKTQPLTHHQNHHAGNPSFQSFPKGPLKATITRRLFQDWTFCSRTSWYVQSVMFTVLGNCQKFFKFH